MNKNILPIQFLTAVRRMTFLLITLAVTAYAHPTQEQLKGSNDPLGVTMVEPKLHAQTLFQMQINPEMRVKVTAGPALPVLIQNEWHTFLVRIENESGTTAPLQITVLNPTNTHSGTKAWLQAEVVNHAMFSAALSGHPLEYRVVRLRCLVTGQREGQFSLHVGQGTQDLGFRSEVAILFQCQPAQTNQSAIRK